MREKRKNQASKSTSSKKTIRKRDISYSLPYSEFPAATGTFTGLAISLLLGLFGAVNTYASSINITIPSGSTVLNTLNDGTFSESSVNASALVWTDNYTGYNLTIMGGNSTGVLEGTKGGTIPSIQEEVNREKFISDTELMNKWGFKPSKLYKSGTTIDNSNYIKSPTSDESVIIDNTKTANDENHKNTYTLALAAKVDNTTPLDSYSQTFTLAATGNATEYHIAYADANNNMPGITYGVSDSGTAKISSTTPHKDGYIFGGWCTVSVVVGQDCAAAGGTIIPVSGDYTLDSTTANNTTLYAIWIGGTIANATYLQEVGSCPSSLEVNRVYTLKDSRDNQSYKVAKLKDNKCWMIENLNIAGGALLTSEDTDFDRNYSLPTDRGWQSGGRLPNSSVTGFNLNNWAYVYNSGVKTNCGTIDQFVPCYSYYSWDAATVGSGRSLSIEGEEAPYSICPKGWRLPTSGGHTDGAWKVSDYYELATSYGAKLENSSIDNSTATGGNFMKNAGPGTPPNFLIAGLYDNGTFSRTAGARYWSSTSYSNAAQASFLYFDSSMVNISDMSNRYSGRSVRCVLRAN